MLYPYWYILASEYNFAYFVQLLNISQVLNTFKSIFVPASCEYFYACAKMQHLWPESNKNVEYSNCPPKNKQKRKEKKKLSILHLCLLYICNILLYIFKNSICTENPLALHRAFLQLVRFFLIENNFRSLIISLSVNKIQPTCLLRC